MHMFYTLLTNNYDTKQSIYLEHAKALYTKILNFKSFHELSDPDIQI